MVSTYDTVSFLSDYGRVDEFVGVVHSVLRTMAPQVHVIDITHDIPPHDVPLATVREQLPVSVVLRGVHDPAAHRRSVRVRVREAAWSQASA